MSTPSDGQPSPHSLRMFQDVSTPPAVDGTSALAEPQTAPTRAPLTALPTTQTSSLERYLAQIADPTLRENLAREIAGMGRTFGLVFERHHPEGIRLPKHRVKRGSKVIINTVKGSGYYRVARLAKDDGTALLVDEDGNQSIYPIDQLTVAKEFGDVMYPGLRKLSEVRNGAPDAPVHTIINGENYHALEALQYTHSGKVDLIYIDPPYNTGNADWKYNDRYIDSKDGYRHSKWLSFMEKRLLIAKQLLKPTGTVAISIDDNEHHRLRMLADQVFGESNFIADLIWRGKGGGQDSGSYAKQHEYVLVFARDASKFVAGRQSSGKNSKEFNLVDASTGRRYKRQLVRKWGSNSLRADRPSMFYAVAAPDGTECFPIHADGTEGRWRWERSTFDKHSAAGDVEFVKNGDSWVPYQRIWEEKAMLSTIPFGTLLPESLGATAQGSIHLKDVMGGKAFDFPKPVGLIEHLIRMTTNSNDAAILDFFGGSGTTAEAVIRLNAEDGGTRQAILVTNNELSKKDDARLRKAGHNPGDEEYEALGVFHHVTKPRLETVITGTRPDGSTYSEGLAANAAFFELTYLEEPEIVTGRALEDLAGLFWLKAGGAGGAVDIDANAKRDGYAISESGAAAILFTPGRARALAEQLKATGQDIGHLFIVTDSQAAGEEAASHFPLGINVERIYGNYLEAFQVNRKD